MCVPYVLSFQFPTLSWLLVWCTVISWPTLAYRADVGYTVWPANLTSCSIAASAAVRPSVRPSVCLSVCLSVTRRSIQVVSSRTVLVTPWRHRAPTSGVEMSIARVTAVNRYRLERLSLFDPDSCWWCLESDVSHRRPIEMTTLC